MRLSDSGRLWDGSLLEQGKRKCAFLFALFRERLTHYAETGNRNGYDARFFEFFVTQLGYHSRKHFPTYR